MDRDVSEHISQSEIDLFLKQADQRIKILHKLTFYVLFAAMDLDSAVKELHLFEAKFDGTKTAYDVWRHVASCYKCRLVYAKIYDYNLPQALKPSGFLWRAYIKTLEPGW